MGSFSCYCAFCGGPLGTHEISIGSRNRYALAARRNRVARVKRDLAAGVKYPRSYDEETLKEERRLEEALKREEPDKSLDNYEWQSGYDPEVVDEKDTKWMDLCRCLGLNRNCEGGPK